MIPPVSAQEPRVLAVSPFTGIGAEPRHDWIGVGIAETVGTDLRRVDDVDVLDRAVVAGAVANLGGAGAGRTAERVVIEAVRELGGDYLLAGSFQQLGEQLRITARLIDVQSETAVEAFKVDGRRSGLFELQDRLADAVRTAVRRRAGRTVGAVRIARGDAMTPAGAGNGAAAGTGNGNGNGGGNGNGRRGGDARDRGSAGARIAQPGGRGGGRGGDTGYRGSAGREAVTPGLARAAGGTGGVADGGELLLGAAPAGGPGPAPAAGAQAGPVAGFAVGSRRSVQARRTSEPPAIDGRLDDAVWRDAVLITDFTQTNPVEGAAPTERTEVRIAYDADHLYFAFHAHYTNPNEMRANRVDRDQIRRDDWIAVMFDTFLDQQRAYRFSVNAYGVQGDAILQGGRRMRGPPGGGGDSSWDALFDTGGAIVADGWTAEMAIPFKSLRYPARGDGEHRWGFQITRTMQTKDETVVWSPMTRAIAGTLTQMGTLGGLRGLSASRNLEFLPTATGIQLGRLTDTGYVEGKAEPDLGLNVKYG